MFYEIKGVLMSDTITDLVKSVTYDAGRQCGSGENERSNLLFHIKKKFVILYVYCNIIDRRGCEGGFRNGKQDNSSDWNEQFHRNSKESLLLY